MKRDDLSSLVSEMESFYDHPFSFGRSGQLQNNTPICRSTNPLVLQSTKSDHGAQATQKRNH
jgi:hypothetical protein